MQDMVGKRFGKLEIVEYEKRKAEKEKEKK